MASEAVKYLTGESGGDLQADKAEQMESAKAQQQQQDQAKEMAAKPPQPVQTFAQMQAAGQARPPAPVSPQMMPPPGGVPPRPVGAAGGNLGLREGIMQMMANPSYYTDELFQQKLRRGGEDLQDQFTQKDRLLKEEMSRRGLRDSSIYGGRSRDLNVERRTAGVDLMQRLAEDQARAMDEGRGRALGLGLQLSAQDMEREMNNLQMGLEREKMALTREVEMGRLSMDQARLRLSQLELDYKQRSDDLDRQFRQSESDRAEGRYGREFDYRSQTDAADRDFREREFGANQDWRRDQFDWEKDAWKRNYDLDVLRLYGIDTADYGDQPTPSNPTGTGGTGYGEYTGGEVNTTSIPPISVQSGYGGQYDPSADEGRFPGDLYDDQYPGGLRR